MQEPSGIERRDMAISNYTPGEALWTRGYPTEDHQVRSGNWNPSVKANEKKKIPLAINIIHKISKSYRSVCNKQYHNDKNQIC